MINIIYNIIYIGFIILSIILKYKKICINCKETIPQDILQIILASIALYYFVGAENIIKTIIIIICSYIFKSIIFYVPKKVVEKCSFCKNPWDILKK